VKFEGERGKIGKEKEERRKMGGREDCCDSREPLALHLGQFLGGGRHDCVRGGYVGGVAIVIGLHGFCLWHFGFVGFWWSS
jgi:uncharacterized protein (DUF779 family)